MSDTVPPSSTPAAVPPQYTAPAPVIVVRRYRPGFGLRLVRSVFGLLLLAAGIVLVAGAQFLFYLTTDPAVMFSYPGPFIGAGLLILGWVVVAGPILGRVVAAVLSLASAAVLLTWPFFALRAQVDAPGGTMSSFTLEGVLLVPLIFVLALAAWLTGRGRSPLAYLLLVLPIATHLILQTTATWGLAWYESLDLRPVIQWIPGIGADVTYAYGLAVLLAVAVTCVPAAILAAVIPPFQGRYNKPEPTPEIA